MSSAPDMNRRPGFFNMGDRDHLPGTLGIVSVEIGSDYSIAEMNIQDRHLNFRGFVHGGSMVALADTAAGYGTYSNLPDQATGFTTLELKCNFIRAVDAGTLSCRAERIHTGRTTEVWDCTVTRKDSEKKVAVFRCTQLILYSR